MRRLLPLLPLVLVFAGCSGSDSESKATLVLHQASIPQAVTAESLVVKDAGGSVVLGPVNLALEATNTVHDVPVSGTRVEIEAHAGAEVSGTFSQALTLTADATVDINVTLQAIDATIADLAFVDPPGEVKAGEAFSLTLRGTDRFGQTVSSGEAKLTLSDGLYHNGQAVGTVTVTLVNGEGTASQLSIRKAGTTQLHAASGAVSKDTPIVVKPADAAQMAVETPLNRTAGTPYDIDVTVVDTYGNVKTDAAEPVTLALAANSARATLKGAVLTQVPVNGVTTFVDVTIEVAAAGLQLEATANGMSSMSYAFSVLPSYLNSLAFSSQPVDVAADAPFSVQVVGQDMFGNTLIDGPSVTLETTGAPFFINGQSQTTVTATIQSGVATFDDLAIHTAGTLSLKASADTFSATSNPFTVGPN